MSVLDKVKLMVGIAKCRLEIAQQRVYGRKLFKLYAGSTTASDRALVAGPCGGNALEAPQPIRDHLGTATQRVLGPLGDSFLGQLQLLEAHQHGLTGLGGLHRGNERHLVRRAPASLAGGLAAEVGVVDLNASIELTRVLSFHHDMQELVLHQPGRFVAHPQVALELQGRDVVFCLREQVHGPKPAHQRQFGRLKDRSAGCRGLLRAGRTLPVLQSLALESAMARASAARADKTCRLSRSHQRCMALFLCSVTLHELCYRKPLLKLNLIDRHDASPIEWMSSSCTRSRSWREPAELRG